MKDIRAAPKDGAGENDDIGSDIWCKEVRIFEMKVRANSCRQERLLEVGATKTCFPPDDLDLQANPK